MINNNEIWKDFPLSPDRIEVSNKGNIRVKERIIYRKKQGDYVMPAKTLTVRPNKNTGYIHLSLPYIKDQLAHRIVAITFIPNPNNKPQVHHKNHIRHDNRIDNLEWVSNSENQIYSFKYGNGNNKGERSPSVKINTQIAKEIRYKYKKGGETHRSLARQYNLSSTHICDIINNKLWNHVEPITKSPPKKYKSYVNKIENIEGEYWYKIPNIIDYELSNLDRVKSLSRVVNRKTQPLKIPEKIISMNISKEGYVVFSVVVNKKRVTLSLHRTKAKVFLPNKKKLPIVNHIDGNPLNNELSNLEWCTDSYNVYHAYSLGLNVSKKGTQHHKAILNDDKVKNIRQKYIPRVYGYVKLAKEFGVARSTIKDIITKRRWRHLL